MFSNALSNFLGGGPCCNCAPFMIPIPTTRQSEPPKGDLLGAGRGRPDAGHGLRASDQKDHRADQAGQTGEHQQIIGFLELDGDIVIIMVQVLMWSATWPREVQKLANDFLHHS